MILKQNLKGGNTSQNCVFTYCQEPFITLNSHFFPCLILTPAGKPGNFIYVQLTDKVKQSETYEYEVEEEERDEKVARLSSLRMDGHDTDLCMSFWYLLIGEHAEEIHVRQRTEGDPGKLIRSVKEHQGKWKEARVSLPLSSLSYEVKSSVQSLCYDIM